MPLDTVDRATPSLFRQGPAPLSKLLVLGSLSFLLMVVDARLKLADPVRTAVATVLMPVQWLAMSPVRMAQSVGEHFGNLQTARQEAQDAQAELTRQALRASQVEQLTQENRELRALIDLKDRLPASAQGAEILYAGADPYSRKVVINQGQNQGIEAGSPVMDAHGILGQVTRVYPATAEVTLLTDGDQVIPVLNTRTGQRSVAYGLPRHGQLELRFVAANADIEPGDLLTTSGIDGIYPTGLPVAKVLDVTRQGDGGFARILCQPMARMEHGLHLLVLTPQPRATPPETKPPVKTTKRIKGARP